MSNRGFIRFFIFVFPGRSFLCRFVILKVIHEIIFAWTTGNDQFYVADIFHPENIFHLIADNYRQLFQQLRYRTFGRIHFGLDHNIKTSAPPENPDADYFQTLQCGSGVFKHTGDRSGIDGNRTGRIIYPDLAARLFTETEPQNKP